MARDYTALPDEYLEEMETLTDEEYGRLIRALQRYHISGVAEEIAGTEKHFYKRVCNREDRYREQFSEIDHRNRINGSKGGRPPKPKETQKTETKTKTKTETNIINNKGESKKEKANEVISAWNTICVDFSAVKMVNDSRVRAINARLNETSLDDIKAVFLLVQASDFLKGNNARGWKATFDWVLNPTNFAKISEGHYKNREAVNRNGHDPKLIEAWSKHPVIGPG